MKNFLVQLALLAIFLSHVYACEKKHEASLIRVIDGDTIIVHQKHDDFNQIRVRLAGIDAPEISQNFGINAQKYLDKLLKGHRLLLKFEGLDRYQRHLAQVYAGKTWVNCLLLEQGLAQRYKYSQHYYNLKLAQCEQAAHTAHRGIWSDPFFMNPRSWRKIKKKKYRHKILNETFH